MNICYQCEDCKRYYNSEEEVVACEKKHAEIRKREEELRKAKKKEKEDLYAMLDKYIEMSTALDKLGQEIAERSGYPFWWTYLDYVNNK